MKIFVILQITSEKLEARDFLLKLRPDRVWKIGDFKERTKLVEKNNGWSISERYDDAVSVSESVADFLKRVEGHCELFKSLPRTCNVMLRCAVYSEDSPALFFNESLVAKMAGINASFDIDLYIGCKST